jgi:hypothetical protein
MKSADTFKSIKRNHPYINIFHPAGKPISPHRLRYSPIAVAKYSSCAAALPLVAISTRE